MVPTLNIDFKETMKNKKKKMNKRNNEHKDKKIFFKRFENKNAIFK